MSAVPELLAQGAHRLAERAERGERGLARVVLGAMPGAAPVLDHVLPPALRVVVTGGVGENGERVHPQGLGMRAPGLLLLARLPALSPSAPSASSPSAPSAARRASVWLAARSMKWTGTPRSRAQRSATHSGENSANGQKAERPGSSVAWASSATGGRMSMSAARWASSSASGGPSMRTAPGWTASSAARTDRAEPGPWCRTPNSQGPRAPA